MKCYIKKDITNEYLVDHYGFKQVPWYDNFNLEHTDKDGLGLQIWWADRSVKILLGEHKEYGIAPIPEILTKLFTDGVIEKGVI